MVKVILNTNHHQEAQKCKSMTLTQTVKTTLVYRQLKQEERGLPVQSPLQVGVLSSSAFNGLLLCVNNDRSLGSGGCGVAEKC